MHISTRVESKWVDDLRKPLLEAGKALFNSLKGVIEGLDVHEFDVGDPTGTNSFDNGVMVIVTMSELSRFYSEAEIDRTMEVMSTVYCEHLENTIKGCDIFMRFIIDLGMHAKFLNGYSIAKSGIVEIRGE